MLAMARAVVELAFSLPEFAADDLPAEMEHGGGGIAGSIFAVLVNRGIIKRAGIWSGQEFYGKERASRRSGRKDAKVKVYVLADAGKAYSFLRTQHRVKQLEQAELAMA